MLMCTVEGQGSVILNGTNGTKWRGIGWDEMEWDRQDRTGTPVLNNDKNVKCQDFIYVQMTS